MPDDEFRVGVIGAGVHARTNILPALTISGATIAGLATRDRDRSAAALRAVGSGGTAYGSADALLSASDIRSVVIVAQPEAQAELTSAAIAAGKHVFVDKPLGWTGPAARDIAGAAEDAEVQVMVGFMRRYAPVSLQLKRILERGELGSVRSFHVRFGCDSTSFAADEEQFVKLAAIHQVDLVRHLLGEVEDVTVTNGSRGRSIALSAAVTLESGVVGTLELVGSAAYASEVDGVRITGDDGWVQSTGTRRIEVRTTDSVSADWRTTGMVTRVLSPADSTMSGGEQDLYLRGFVGEFHHFADVVRSGAPASSSGWDNARTAELCDRLVTAAAARAITSSRHVSPGPLLRTLAFGDPGLAREQFNKAILSGAKTSSSDLRVAHRMGGEPLPEVGEERLLVDSAERPIAVLKYTRVVLFRLGEVTPETTALEGLDVEAWEEQHLAYWRTVAPAIQRHLQDPLWEPGPDTAVVTTVFQVSSLPDTEARA